VVLVIEDEPSGRELMASYLQPLGITSNSPYGGSRLAMAHRIGPDAITLDLQLPTGMDGVFWRSASYSGHEPCAYFVVSVLDKDPSAFRRGATDICKNRSARSSAARIAPPRARPFRRIEQDSSDQMTLQPHKAIATDDEPIIRMVIIDDNAGSLELLSTALAPSEACDSQRAWIARKKASDHSC